VARGVIASAPCFALVVYFSDFVIVIFSGAMFNNAQVICLFVSASSLFLYDSASIMLLTKSGYSWPV
jgi:hypothetical protein